MNTDAARADGLTDAALAVLPALERAGVHRLHHHRAVDGAGRRAVRRRSVANLLALGAARQAAFERRGVDVGRDGLPPGVQGRIYASSEAHHTIQRSAAVLGLGRDAVRPVPVDAQQRIRVDTLATMIDEDVAAGVLPVAIVGVAGTTNTGAVDPLDALADLAERHGTWLHVDGAYGLPAAGVDELAGRFSGVRRAQSWIVDPHKWLATGVGCAATYVRDARLLNRSFTQTPAAYLAMPGSGAVASPFEEFGVHYDDLGVELSAPPRGVLVWAVLREIGRRGLHERIRRHVGYAHRLTALARSHPRLEALTEPELSVACLRYRPAQPVSDVELDALNEELLRRLWRTTGHLPSSTVVAGRFAIRPCFIGVRHAEADVVGLADTLVELGDALLAEAPAHRPAG